MKANRLALAISFIFAMVAAGAAPQPAGCAQNMYGTVYCGPPESGCIADRQNEIWCSPPGGAIELDIDGVAVCGVGMCTKDQRAGVFCSNTPHGGAMTDSYGKVACVGSCVPASRSLCTKPAPMPIR